MDLNHRSTGYEPVGITWLPHPASHHKYEDCIYVFTGYCLDFDFTMFCQHQYSELISIDVLSGHSVLWPSLVVSDLPQLFSESFLKKFGNSRVSFFCMVGDKPFNFFIKILRDAQSPVTLSFGISRGHSREEFTLVAVKEDENKNKSKPQSKS